MDDLYCSDCKKETQVVFDHSTGDTICLDCGLVLEAYSIDETCEWRTFDDSGDNYDPVRVGGPTNPLLSHGGLSVVISKPVSNNKPNADFLSFTSSSTNLVSNPDQSLLLAFRKIATMCDSLSLVKTINDRANEIYKKAEDGKICKGKKKDAVLGACLYIACREEDKPRTIKEISSVANGATKKEIGRAMEALARLEKEGKSVEIASVRAGDFMRRFCSNLGMIHQSVKAAEEAVKKSQEFDIRRSPLSIAAVVIYIVTQLSGNKKSLKDVSVATGVAQGTIRSSYKDLCPHLEKIIPSWYAQKEDLRNIRRP